MSADVVLNVKDAFDARSLNVMAIRSTHDCEIAIAEIKHQCENIEEDLKLGGSKDWEASARRALKDYQHKARLCAIHMEYLKSLPAKAPSDKPKPTAEQLLHARFYIAAKANLDGDAFRKISAFSEVIKYNGGQKS